MKDIKETYAAADADALEHTVAAQLLPHKVAVDQTCVREAGLSAT